MSRPSERALPSNVCVERNSGSDTRQVPSWRQRAASVRRVSRCPLASLEKISNKVLSISGKGLADSSTGAPVSVGAVAASDQVDVSGAPPWA